MNVSKSLSKKAITARRISKGVTNYYYKNAGLKNKENRLRINKKEK